MSKTVRNNAAVLDLTSSIYSFAGKPSSGSFNTSGVFPQLGQGAGVCSLSALIKKRWLLNGFSLGPFLAFN